MDMSEGKFRKNKTYQVRIKPSVEKELKKIPAKDQQKIVLAMAHLSADPLLGNALLGKYKSLYSLRVLALQSDIYC